MEELDEETLSRITGHVLESIWAHLEEHGIEGFPSRVSEEAWDSDRLTGERIANLEAQVAGLDGAQAGGGDLDARLSALEARVEQLNQGGGGGVSDAELNAKIDRMLEDKVEDLDLESLRDRVLRSVKSRLGDEPAPAATAATVSTGGAPSRDELIKLLDLDKIARRLEHMAIHPVLKAIDERMKATKVEEAAEEAAEKAISKRFSTDVLEQVSGQGQVVDDLDAKLRQLEEKLEAKLEAQASLAGAPSGVLQNEQGKPMKLTEDRHFLALAREVKTLRDNLNLVEMFNSREFKEIFDRRINQVISYLRNDAIPSAVKKVMSEA